MIWNNNLLKTMIIKGEYDLNKTPSFNPLKLSLIATLIILCMFSANYVHAMQGGNGNTGSGKIGKFNQGKSSHGSTTDATPPTTTASPSGGTYTSAQSVTLSANEPATIYYTLDGTIPTTSSTIYSSPIPISTTTTLQFFAKDTAGNVESVKTGTYTINLIQISDTDSFGIKKIYHTKVGSSEWYVSMENPTGDPYFKNWQNLQLIKQPDGSWQVQNLIDGQVRMEDWSIKNEKWLNVEITEYAKILSGTNNLLQLYSRGGHHTMTDQCLGSAYKARLYGDGRAAWVKEVNHPAYAGIKGTVQATTEPLQGRWVGFKAVIYNFIENGKTYVHLESYIDDNVTDPNGNLVIRNDWRLASVYEDKGNWSAASDPDFVATCFPLSVDNSGPYRQADEILNLPGGTGTQNLAAFRTDQITWDFKYLTVREIEPPTS